MTTDASTPPVTPPPAAPVVDVAAITKAAVDAAKEQAKTDTANVAADIKKSITTALNGEDKSDPSDSFLKAFAKDPVRAFQMTKEAAKNEVLEIIAHDNNTKKIQTQVVAPLLQEYPGLNSDKKMAMVEKITEKYQAQGKTYQEALKLACDDTIKDLGLKSVSQIQQEEESNAGALPNGGGYLGNPPSQISNAKSSSDFLTGMKDRAAAFRQRK